MSSEPALLMIHGDSRLDTSEGTKGEAYSLRAPDVVLCRTILARSITSRMCDAFRSQVYSAAVRAAASPSELRQFASFASLTSHSDRVFVSDGSSRIRPSVP